MWYGAIVFAIEMLGAMSIIFYGVWLIATPNNSDIIGLDSAATLRRQYHIRVLVPCYSEPLAIVQRTVLAARRAIVPDGCQVPHRSSSPSSFPTQMGVWSKRSKLRRWGDVLGVMTALVALHASLPKDGHCACRAARCCASVATYVGLQ